MEATDLVLPGRQPVVIRRAYRTQEPGNNNPIQNPELFGFRTVLLDYDEQLLAGPQVLVYIADFGQIVLAQQPGSAIIRK